MQEIPHGKPASLLQVGGRAERRAKAKNFSVSSNACRADRKVRMTPPRSFSLSPCDAHSRCTSGAGTTHRLPVTGAANQRQSRGFYLRAVSKTQTS